MPAEKFWVLLALGAAGVGMLVFHRGKNKILGPHVGMVLGKEKVKDDFGAFIEQLNLLPPLQPELPDAPLLLTGLDFAIDELFDVKGCVTGFGNPDWRRTHEPAIETAPSVSLLVQGGATCIGRSVMAEMAYSINGENKHYGTPLNPDDPSRLPGGPSSGSAVAVAAKLVDFSLGFDSGGGVMVPAAFCGILGFHPSYGTVSTDGVVPVAQSFDTVGCFARDPDILHRIGHVLLRRPVTELRNPMRIIFANDCFQIRKFPCNQTKAAVVRSTKKLFGREVIHDIILGDYIASKVPSLKYFQTEESKNGRVWLSALMALCNAFQFLQRYEFKQNHKDWVSTANPDFGPGASAQIHQALQTSADDRMVVHSLNVRNEVRKALNSLLKDYDILVIPTTPGPPPKLNREEIVLRDFWTRASTLCSIAGMSGCCQVSIPVGHNDKGPLAVSFIARRGRDMFLLDTVQTTYRTLQEHVQIHSSTEPATAKDDTIEAAEIASEKGIVACEEKQWQKAIKLFSKAINLNGNSSSYYSARALAHLYLKSYPQAEADCTTAVALDEKNVRAYLRRGISREMLGYYKGAIQDLNHVLVHEPSSKIGKAARSRLNKWHIL